MKKELAVMTLALLGGGLFALVMYESLCKLIGI